MTTCTPVESPLLRQHGSALIVSLLILLVLTIIGVTSMSTTALQSKMATNSREYNLAFQATESALRDGEIEIRNLNPSGFACASTNGLWLTTATASSTCPQPDWRNFDWTTGRTYGSQTGATDLVGLASKPRYFIEKLPPAPMPGDSTSQMSCYNCGLTIQNYRVTASGTGANGTAAVILQSVFRP